jgi:hypothetical protein
VQYAGITLDDATEILPVTGMAKGRALETGLGLGKEKVAASAQGTARLGPEPVYCVNG